MVIPLWSILIPYGLILLIFVVFSVFNLYHLFKFGFLNFSSVLFTLIFLFVSAALLLWTYQKLEFIDWYQPLYIFDGLPAIQFGPGTIMQ